MRRARCCFFILTGFFVVGCSSMQPVKKVSESSSEFEGALYSGETDVVDKDEIGAEKYRVFSQGASSFVPQSAVRSNAESRATKFCREQGRALKVLEERRSVPPHILGNFPRSELIFICIEPLQDSSADTKQATDRGKGTKYNQLKELKKLKEDDLITEKDYENQKAKILAK